MINRIIGEHQFYKSTGKIRFSNKGNKPFVIDEINNMNFTCRNLLQAHEVEVLGESQFNSNCFFTGEKNEFRDIFAQNFKCFNSNFDGICEFNDDVRIKGDLSLDGSKFVVRLKPDFLQGLKIANGLEVDNIKAKDIKCNKLVDLNSINFKRNKIKSNKKDLELIAENKIVLNCKGYIEAGQDIYSNHSILTKSVFEICSVLNTIIEENYHIDSYNFINNRLFNLKPMGNFMIICPTSKEILDNLKLKVKNMSYLIEIRNESTEFNLELGEAEGINIHGTREIRRNMIRSFRVIIDPDKREIDLFSVNSNNL